MIRTEKRIRLCRWLIALILCFIWGNSMLPGEISGAFSDWVKEILAAIFPGDVPGVTTGGGLLRKIAHFSEFAALGACLCWYCSMMGKRKFVPLLCGFGAACVDETIQLFVPDRGPSLKDVCIDTCGVAFGIMLLLIGATVSKKIKCSKENTL